MEFKNQFAFLTAWKCLSDETKKEVKKWSVGGSLDLRGTQITSLPEGLSVGGWLVLRGTQITSLAERFNNEVIY